MLIYIYGIYLHCGTYYYFIKPCGTCDLVHVYVHAHAEGEKIIVTVLAIVCKMCLGGKKLVLLEIASFQGLLPPPSNNICETFAPCTNLRREKAWKIYNPWF